MAQAVTEVQAAAAALAQVEVKRHGVQQRLQQAQQALNGAGDDVDKHVAASQEAAGCQAALAFLDKQQAELTQALQEAKKQEAKLQSAKLGAEVDTLLRELRHTLTGAYQTASTAAELELRASGLVGSMPGGPAAATQDRLLRVLEALGGRSYLQPDGKYEVKWQDN